MIKIIEDDIIDHVSEYDVSLIGANLYSTMNGGFQQDVKNLYPYVRKINLQTKYGDLDKLGTIVECKEENQPTFCLCYILKEVNTKKTNVNYDSLEKCLKTINILYKGKKIALPILGSSNFDGNGDKDKILSIITQTLTDVNADIYDFVQENRATKWAKAYKTAQQLKKTNHEEYIKFIEKSKKKLTIKATLKNYESPIKSYKRPY